MVRKGGLEPPCLSAPPPQDGVSANSTTSARFALIITKPGAPTVDATSVKLRKERPAPNTSQSPQTTSDPDWPRPPGPHRFLLPPSVPWRFPVYRAAIENPQVGGEFLAESL